MAKEYPGTILEFEQWFRSEEACRDYLARLRWPQGFRCPSCGHANAWKARRLLFHCGGCRRDVSVTAGTVFHRSRLSLRIWFRASWWMTNQKGGVSALGLQRLLGLGSYQTAWSCLHRLRRAMVRPGREKLSGSIEVDETFVGGLRKGNSSKHEKAIVAVAVERRGSGMGRVRLARIANVDSASLRQFVESTIEPGSQLITDGWPAYRCLKEAGYRHEPTTLSGHGREASVALLPRVHRVASLLKRWLMGTHQGRVTGHQLDPYLEEFSFRFNRRLSPQRGMLFYRLLQQCMVTTG